MATLIVLAGLPGAGKTRVARALALRSGAAVLAIDAIDTALWRIDPGRDSAAESYLIAAALAEGNLQVGLNVIADCVNPWPESRQVFAQAAARAGAVLLRVEITCSDPAEHRRRIDARQDGAEGRTPPDWQAVQARDYAPWTEADLRIDTAGTDPRAAAARIAARIA